MTQQRVTPTIFLRIYALLLLAVLAMLGYNEWTTRSDALTQAAEKSRALVNLATEHTLRMFEINDIALRSAVEHFSELDISSMGRSWANWDYLATLEASSIGSELAQIRHMLIIDPTGTIRIHSRRFPFEPVDGSRNDFFQVHKETSGPSSRCFRPKSATGPTIFSGWAIRAASSHRRSLSCVTPTAASGAY